MVEVDASSEQLDATSDAFGSRIETTQVQELPLDGRDWSTLTALVTGLSQLSTSEPVKCFGISQG